MRVKVLVLVAAAVACTTMTEPDLGDEFELGVGEQVALTDIGLWVAFVGVSEDSRCPSQVMCVWAGNATVLVATAPYPDVLSSGSRTDTLHTNSDPTSLAFGSYELVLVRLDPYPETPSSISRDEYIATFVIRARR